MESYRYIKDKISANDKWKTKDSAEISKYLIANHISVDDLEPHIEENFIYKYIYIRVSLHNIKNINDRYVFLEGIFNHFNSWYSVDQCIQFIKDKNISNQLKHCKKYCNNKNPFVQRWGYVLLLQGAGKDPTTFNEIFSYFHNSVDYFVQMGIAWVIATMAIYDSKQIYDYINSKLLAYNIIGKAIQKISDSFRIEDEFKTKVKKLRELYRED